ncbi:ParD-like family protein [Flagellatimonas centrodinii]|uniref:ParD-like family protein n=1 Tax=Flagellatimonas centrodinii TaxID=2806210 RepID=UPI001FFDA588|nr:ParD-like family protein [Flagellatimonas centrodinii]ULQ46629.1 ParD-like family protein [Flagellatimonas centrodinii]
MPTPSPVRLDADLSDAARAVAPTMSRSVAQQLSHWARIGRELERTPGISLEAIQAVLGGGGDYDALNIREQAMVRVDWKSQISERRAALQLDEAFAQEGHRYAELDARGRVVEKPATQRARRRKAQG